MQLDVLEQYDRRFFYEDAIRIRQSVYDAPVQVVNRILHNEHPIKVFREYRRFSRRQLGQRAGVSPAYIAAIESGKLVPTQDVLRNIACTLRVSLDDIA